MTAAQNHVQPDRSFASVAPLAPFARFLLERLRERQEQSDFSFEAEGQRFTMPRAEAQELLANIASLESAPMATTRKVPFVEAAESMNISDEHLTNLIAKCDIELHKSKNGENFITIDDIAKIKKRLFRERQAMMSRVTRMNHKMGLYDE
jgi:hypothetical protein